MEKFNNAKEVIEQIAKLQAENENNIPEFCPRCGLENMRTRLYANALSRYENVYICSDCGISEAMSDFLGEENNFENWFIVKECREEGVLN